MDRTPHRAPVHVRAVDLERLIRARKGLKLMEEQAANPKLPASRRRHLNQQIALLKQAIDKHTKKNITLVYESPD